MPLVRLNKHQHDGIPAGASPRSLVRLRTLARLLRPLYKALHISTDGLDGMETANGIHLKSNAGRSDVRPFNVITTSDGTNLYYQVEPGYIAGQMPLLDGTPLDHDPRPSAIMSRTTPAVVYVQLTLDLNVANGYVYGGTFNSALIAASGALPDDDLAAGIYYIALAYFNDGVKDLALQPVLVDLNFYLEDTGLGDGTAICKFIAA